MLTYNKNTQFRYYQDKLPLKSKLLRLLWGVAYVVLFRPTPRWAMSAWRVFLLRLFGAEIGKGCRIAPSCKIWAPWNLRIKALTCLGGDVDCYSVSPILIGTNVAISQRAFLCPASHDISTYQRELIHAPIHIEDHVWIAAGAFIGPGVHIGEGAVIGAHAVVTKDVEPWAVMVGNPARKVKNRVIRNP
jgi:putative colanic acid biosynthesis acetyltransferase WcaF